ncbi:MAG: hypothetical protein JXR94_17240 [Candidatus Hydrogenedentes bacterium]|nr:hypothetical protein [Candidatus Hydrogenedentota bacterium]
MMMCLSSAFAEVPSAVRCLPTGDQDYFVQPAGTELTEAKKKGAAPAEIEIDVDPETSTIPAFTWFTLAASGGGDCDNVAGNCGTIVTGNEICSTEERTRDLDVECDPGWAHVTMWTNCDENYYWDTDDPRAEILLPSINEYEGYAFKNNQKVYILTADNTSHQIKITCWRPGCYKEYDGFAESEATITVSPVALPNPEQLTVKPTASVTTAKIQSMFDWTNEALIVDGDGPSRLIDSDCNGTLGPGSIGEDDFSVPKSYVPIISPNAPEFRGDYIYRYGTQFIKEECMLGDRDWWESLSEQVLVCQGYTPVGYDFDAETCTLDSTTAGQAFGPSARPMVVCEDRLPILVHELGHIVGLSHIAPGGAHWKNVMWASESENHTFLDTSVDTVSGTQNQTSGW